MKMIFESVKEIEKEISCLYSSDEFIAESIMIENAAMSLEKAISKSVSKIKSVLIMCGSGNNGADGYALCRRLAGKYKIHLLKVSEPKSIHCQKSFENLKPLLKKSIDLIELKSEVKDTKLEKIIAESSVIIDCIFGTGFYGLVDKNISNLFKIVNHSDGFRIACDVPSGIDLTASNISSFTLQEKKHHVFFADLTVTMGAHKMSLFSDNAKDAVGKIQLEEIGISKNLFYEKADKVFPKNKIFLLEKKDAILPIRNELNTHKGSFGHSTVIGGDKLGAAILSATSAFRVGAGLTSIVRDKAEKGFSQDGVEFKVMPCLMLTDSVMENVTSMVLGCGLGKGRDVGKYFELLKKRKMAVVFDADIFYYDELIKYLDYTIEEEISEDKSKNNECTNCADKIILTPHLKEFSVLLNKCGIGEYSVCDIINNRVQLMRLFCNKYKNVLLVLKGANTFIGKKNKIYVCNLGHPSLSKGGSGDVLAGAISGLLSQNYDAIDAAITGVLMHAIASNNFSKTYNLIPEDLILEL